MDISLMDNGSDTCNLFEGFIDSLSWLELGLGYGDDYLVLNSVSLLERSFPILDRYEMCIRDRALPVWERFSMWRIVYGRLWHVPSLWMSFRFCVRSLWGFVSCSFRRCV